MFHTALAISQGEVILVVFFAALPVAALMFALGARQALASIGKGRFAIEQELPRPRRAGALAAAPAESEAERRVRSDEVRQMLEAKAFRQRRRGERPLDVEAELDRLLSSERETRERSASSIAGDPALMAEVRAHVAARNERRMARGERPLDVEAEVERQLRSLGDP